MIIPTFDRADLISRAIRSCIAQSYDNFEVIVIDDGSRDNTIELIAALNDPRIVVLRHDSNRGVCAARNTGVARANGAWLLLLDSDVELMPGALGRLASRTARAAPDVGNVASSCLWDTGILTPMPDVPEGALGYEAFLGWIDRLTVTEWFNCIRRDVFQTIRFPEGRAYEGSFHLDLARRWKIEVSREPAVIYHTDAKDRITKASPDVMTRRLLRDAADNAKDAEAILRHHGKALRRWAPAGYRLRVHLAGMYFFLAGERGKGAYYTLLALARAPGKLQSWAVLLLGLLGKRVLAWTKARFGK